MTSIIPKDFQLINTWTVDSAGPTCFNRLYGEETPAYLIDQSTGQSYWNESKGVVGVICYYLMLGTPVVHTVASVANVAYRTFKLGRAAYQLFKLSSGLHSKTLDPERESDLKARIKEVKAEAKKDLIRIAMAPLALIGLELAAIYGIFNPYDGRKLYASIERAQYGKAILAPSFQPNQIHPDIRGNPNQLILT